MNDRTRPHAQQRIGRRRFLATTAALVATASSGTTWLAWRSIDRQAWIEFVVRKHLPNIDLDAASLTRFGREFAHHYIFDNWRSGVALRLDYIAPRIAHSLSTTQRRVSLMERLALSEFLMGSNFFRVSDPCRIQIVYGGPVLACGNPFAMFHTD
ncbi:hypothetical protein ACG33_07455 [Steroidobacter denitrificans]|uniref:Uncharacterized protein n=1 Tax=Steroidobacter denitrificans TaxID=465721 RepID=A0A127F935_STEDE|nr:hypothetical protein [Steroidobacter denitrificans]AMN46934.1 hypothetical protein ACG33_07455 [Steroidobacter denitrificans]